MLTPTPIGVKAVHNLVRTHALALPANVLGFSLQPVSDSLPQPHLVRLEDEADEIKAPRFNGEHLPVWLDLQFVVCFKRLIVSFPKTQAARQPHD